MDRDYKIAFLDVLSSVVVHREEQIKKHGNNNYPDGTRADLMPFLEAVQRICTHNTDAGTVTWREVLTEEVLEAFTETDERKLEKELIQIATVAAAWVTCLRRRRVMLKPSTVEAAPGKSNIRTHKTLPRPEDGLKSPYKDAE